MEMDLQRWADEASAFHNSFRGRLRDDGDEVRRFAWITGPTTLERFQFKKVLKSLGFLSIMSFENGIRAACLLHARYSIFRGL